MSSISRDAPRRATLGLLALFCRGCSSFGGSRRRAFDPRFDGRCA